jgi:hypothetical protein
MATIQKGSGDARKARRRRAVDDETPTANDNLMYLLYELERAMEQPTISWSAELVATAQRRLEALAANIRRMAPRQD